MPKSKKIIFAGAGKMASAIASGLISKGFSAKNISAFDKSESAAHKFKSHTGVQALVASGITEKLKKAIAASDIVILSVKPQSIHEMTELGEFFKNKFIISIVTGIPLKTLSEITKSSRAVRVMPNTPALIGEGISAYAHLAGISSQDIKTVESILSSFGECCLVEEKLMDAVTGLSGSGPAYVFDFIQGLTDGGVHAGLSRDIAFRLAVKTVEGAAKMLLKTGEHPSILKDNVTSPGGTTARGLSVLEKGSFRGLVAEAVTAAAARASELGNIKK